MRFSLPFFGFRSARWAVLFWAVLGLGLGVLFAVPASVRPPVADSESYLFGFNNKLWEALLFLLAVALLVTARAGKLSVEVPRRTGLVEERSAGEEVGGLTTRLVVMCSGITAALAGVLIWIVLPVGAVNDGSYFLDRILLMQRGAVRHEVFPTASEIVFAPFDYRPLKVSNYQSATLDKGYFMGSLNVLTPVQVSEKILELRRRPSEDVVMSWDDFAQCAVKTGDRSELRELLLLPWVPTPSATLSYRVPLCTYIRSTYHWVAEPSPATFGYGLLRRDALSR